MSNLFKYTKRVLTSVLAAAVVLTAIPSTAFGAEIDEDLAIEVQEAEVAEAGEEVVERVPGGGILVPAVLQTEHRVCQHHIAVLRLPRLLRLEEQGPSVVIFGEPRLEGFDILKRGIIEVAVLQFFERHVEDEVEVVNG